MAGVTHLVLAGIPGTSLTASVRRRLARLDPGGIVLFRRNIGAPRELVRLTDDLRRLLGPETLLAIDQEGGRVARLREPFTIWPPMREVGRCRRSDIARAVGRILGAELAAAGLNVDFAPVLDVDSNPANPVIGDRAFGADAALVARLGLALAGGLEESGVLPCVKHFPGHGDTALDSHLALPVVERSRRELARVELRPFRAAVRAGVPLLMSAHVLYPALDPDRPATLSRRILRDLLRDRLGYAGVVVSDDLAMHALDAVGDPGDVALAALEAGCDMLLACQSLEDGERVAAALAAAMPRQPAIEASARTAARRVARLRRRVGRLGRRREDLDDVLSRDDGRLLVERIARVTADLSSR